MTDTSACGWCTGGNTFSSSSSSQRRGKEKKIGEEEEEEESANAELWMWRGGGEGGAREGFLRRPYFPDRKA